MCSVAFSGPSNKTRSYLPVDMPRPPIRSLDFRAPADHHTIDFSFRSGDKTATSFQSSFDRQSCLDAPQLVLVDRQSPELGRTSLERPTPPRKPFTVTAEIKRDDTKLKSLPKPSAMNGLKALVAASCKCPPARHCGDSWACQPDSVHVIFRVQFVTSLRTNLCSFSANRVAHYHAKLTFEPSSSGR